MLGLPTIRNPYLATASILLVLLPLVWVPGHSHSIGVARAHCSACLLTVFSTTILAAGVIAILLMRDWHEQVELSARLLARRTPSLLGRAPPLSTSR